MKLRGLFKRASSSCETATGHSTEHSAQNPNPSSVHHTRFDLFLDLPEDIILLIPDHLHDAEDLINLSRTCRALRHLPEKTLPHTLLRLCSESSLPFFWPKSYFIVLAVAGQLAEWASRSQQNVVQLREAFRGGIHGLLDLCVEHCGLTTERIREMHALKYSTINPIVDLMDKCVGVQWYATPNFWNGGVPDAITIDAEPCESFYHLAIYGELFGPTLRAWLETGAMAIGSKGVVVGDVATRMEFVKYCIPDPGCCDMRSQIQDFTNLMDGSILPLRRCDRVGPYEDPEYDHKRQKEGQMALDHLIHSQRFQSFWWSVRSLTGPDFVPSIEAEIDWDLANWKQDIWEVVVLSYGLEGLRSAMAIDKLEESCNGVKILNGDEEEGIIECRRRLLTWKMTIDKMENRPEEVVVGPCKTYVFPYLRGDLEIAVGIYD